MPDCDEKLNRGYATIHARSNKVDEKFGKKKICLKCADRDIYDIIGAMAGHAFDYDEIVKLKLVKTNILGEQEVSFYDDDGVLLRTIALRVKRKR